MDVRCYLIVRLADGVRPCMLVCDVCVSIYACVYVWAYVYQLCVDRSSSVVGPIIRPSVCAIVGLVICLVLRCVANVSVCLYMCFSI